MVVWRSVWDVTADVRGEGCLAVVVDPQDAVFCHHCVELLLVVRNPWRQRREVPVQVGVALLAAQTHRVHPLGGQCRLDGTRHFVHDGLEVEELTLPHVVHPALQVTLRRNEAVTEQSRVAGEKSDAVVVLVDEMVPKVGVPSYERADEARPFAHPTRVLIEVERGPRGLVSHTETVDRLRSRNARRSCP